MVSLADTILEEDVSSVKQLLRYSHEINQIDEYGFTPLIEAAIVDNLEISKLLLSQGADPNLPDVTGGCALQWAVENHDIALCQLLLENHANPNSYNLAGQPVLVMAILRQQHELKNLLVHAGADLTFAQDYINTKLLGHMYELIGTVSIIDPQNNFVEVDFEGFFLEITLGLIADSVFHFQNHFAARQLRRYSGLAQFIVQVMERASQLIKYQQYLVDVSKHQKQINSLIRQEPLLIPVGYEGHAITFILYGNTWVKCDRREDSRLYDNIMFYRINNMQNVTPELLKALIYEKQSSAFINNELDELLGLEAVTELKVDAQISGNCSWANVEAAIPAMFFLVMMEMNKNISNTAYYKTLALNFYSRWREWNKDRALHFCIESFENADRIRKASKAEILAAILFQRCTSQSAEDRDRMDRILAVLMHSPYEYIIRNYVRVYYYESNTPEGKQFFEMLKDRGYLP